MGWTKEYISGSAKTIEFANGGKIVNVSFKESELPKFRKVKAKSGDVYLSFTLSERPEVDQFGNSHSLQVSKPDDEVEEASGSKASKKDDVDGDW